MGTVARKQGPIMVRMVDVESAARGQHEEQLEQLRRRPADLDDAVEVLRFSLAWRLEADDVDAVARASGVEAGRVECFMLAPARQAGQLLTLAEAARLMRVVEARVEDRGLAGELDDLRRIAEPYLEVAGINFGVALARARQARRAYRAANPAAPTLGRD
jgi:hypothetical protein